MVKNHLKGAHFDPYSGFLHNSPKLLTLLSACEAYNDPSHLSPVIAIQGGCSAMYRSLNARLCDWRKARVMSTMITSQLFSTEVERRILYIDLSTVGADTKLLNRIPTLSPLRQSRALTFPFPLRRTTSVV